MRLSKGKILNEMGITTHFNLRKNNNDGGIITSVQLAAAFENEKIVMKS